MILAANIAGHLLFIMVASSMCILSTWHAISRKGDRDRVFYAGFAFLTLWATVKDVTELVIILSLNYVPYANTVAIFFHFLAMISIGFLILRSK